MPRLLIQAKPGNQLKRKAAEESAPAGALSKAAKTGTGSDSSPRRKLTVKRSESISRTALTEGGQRTVDNAGEANAKQALSPAPPHHHVQVAQSRIQFVLKLRRPMIFQHAVAMCDPKPGIRLQALRMIFSCTYRAHARDAHQCELLACCSAVDRPSDAAAKGASPGRSAGAGSAAWAPSPSRFRRSAQENRAPAAAFRRVIATPSSLPALQLLSLALPGCHMHKQGCCAA